MADKDSSPPKEVDRLKRDLKKREEADITNRFITLDNRFNTLEQNLKEVRAMAEEEHFCNKERDFSSIEKSFEDGRDEFKAIHKRFESMSKVRLWTYLGVLVVIVVAMLSAMYSYARNETNWEYTTERVRAVETTAKSTNKNVNDMIVSFKIMEETNKQMGSKLKDVSPKKIEDAVSRGIRNAKRR